MQDLRAQPRVRRRSLFAAGAVHALTGSGAVCAFFATQAVLNHHFETAFLWLGAALIIDGVDGVFARAAKVSEVLARFSGERLDLIVDYLTYVFVPVLALLEGGFLVGWPGFIAAALILLSALFHFADLDSKANDNCFVGFPALWNLFAFYVFALALPALANLLAVAIFVVLTFIPWRWVHPLRVRAARPLTVLVAGMWAAVAVWTLVRGFPAHGVQTTFLVVAAVYVCGLALIWRRAPRANN